MNDQNCNLLQFCRLCPRNCRVDRTTSNIGYCGQDSKIRLARAALHFWEEPCISGKSGSGAVFFSGCSLKCIYCQNSDIANGTVGREVSMERLITIFLELQGQGASNINLITGTHFVPQIRVTLIEAKKRGLQIPIVYNTSSYETVETLELLRGLVDIYIPDMKYYSSDLALKFSNAPDYFFVAKRAIDQMVHQVGQPQFDENTGLMKKGVIVRHLVLPSHIKDSKQVLHYLHHTYNDKIFISIMNQYTPTNIKVSYEELKRTLTKREYNRVIDYAMEIGITNAFIQEGITARESFIPNFNYKGI